MPQQAMVAMIDFLKTKAHQMQNTTIQDSKYAKTLGKYRLYIFGVLIHNYFIYSALFLAFDGSTSK